MLSYERDRDGVIRYESKLIGPLDGCSMEIVYLPNKENWLGTLQLTLNSDRSLEKVARLAVKIVGEVEGDLMKARCEIQEVEDAIDLAISEEDGVSLMPQGYTADMAYLCSWFVRNWFGKLVWKKMVLPVKGDSEWEKMVENWVENLSRESFFTNGEATLKGGMRLAVKLPEDYHETGTGWFRVELKTGDGMVGELKGMLFEKEDGVEWLLSDDLGWEKEVDTESFDEQIDDELDLSMGDPLLKDWKKIALYFGVRYLSAKFDQVAVRGSGGDKQTGVIDIDDEAMREYSRRWLGF